MNNKAKRIEFIFIVKTEEENEMFCKYCGEQNPDNASFCKKCGGKLKEGQKTDSKSKNGGEFAIDNLNSQKKSFKIRPSIIAIATVIFVVIITATQLFGGRSYKKTIDIFFTSVMNGDGEKLIKTLPDEMIDYAMEEEGYTSREEIEQKIEDLLTGSMINTLNDSYGDDWSYDYEIVDTEDYTSEELESLKEKYQTEFLDIKIKNAKTVTLKFTLKVKDVDDQSGTFDFTVIKVGRSWYIDLMSFNSGF